MAVDRKVNSGGKVGKAEQLKSRDKSPRFALLKRCSVHTSWVKSEGRLQAITTSHRSSLLPTTLSKQEHVQGAYTFQPQEVQHLSLVNSCDVSDALLKLDHPHGGFLSGLYGEVHPASNYSCSTLSVTDSGKDNVVSSAPGRTYKVCRAGLHCQIDHVPPEHILFVAGPKGTVNALYGGLMSRRAKARAVAGTVVDGRIRDIQEHRDLGYPVFARDTSTVSPQEKLHVGEVNGPVTLQSDEEPKTVIQPGDYLMGDVNGVVCLPQHLAEKVVALIPSQVEADERIGVEIDNGGSFAEMSRLHRVGVKKARDL
ncbi:MAG: hypothetical protein LQ348_002877 [Seirophora lacunosa]|nr:MAG: hypothetical protein LQ348_002877 [Seirophora lacunosa]